mmetsp:Transcript_40343/g.79266  ORF Transcript_40343/g.79266 Transcript_40343/m.79266 type:complete len:228 (-) Transcript_40343:1043-1726(-)
MPCNALDVDPVLDFVEQLVLFDHPPPQRLETRRDEIDRCSSVLVGSVAQVEVDDRGSDPHQPIVCRQCLCVPVVAQAGQVGRTPRDKSAAVVDLQECEEALVQVLLQVFPLRVWRERVLVRAEQLRVEFLVPQHSQSHFLCFDAGFEFCDVLTGSRDVLGPQVLLQQGGHGNHRPALRLHHSPQIADVVSSSGVWRSSATDNLFDRDLVLVRQAEDCLLPRRDEGGA